MLSNDIYLINYITLIKYIYIYFNMVVHYCFKLALNQ
jgi:hypothetical protein